MYTEGKKKRSRRGVVKLSPIIALDALDRAPKLSADIRKELSESREGVRLEAQRKRPGIMGEIIKNDKVVFKTRNTSNRGRP